MRFYLGTHVPSWLGWIDVPLFLSRPTMPKRILPRAVVPWCLDSGGFTALMSGAWQVRTRHPYKFTLAEYAADVRRYQDEIGMLEWAAPMDWMCEPEILWRHGLGVHAHQQHTIENFQALRADLGEVIIPVLQGWTVSDYARCVEMYDDAGIDLHAERVVGVGSICRRNQDKQIGDVLRSLDGFPIHALGVRGKALAENLHMLASADSMAWSFAARRNEPLEGCTHKNCANCPRYALRWRERLLAKAAAATPQLRLEIP